MLGLAGEAAAAQLSRGGCSLERPGHRFVVASAWRAKAWQRQPYRVQTSADDPRGHAAGRVSGEGRRYGRDEVAASVYESVAPGGGVLWQREWCAGSHAIPLPACRAAVP